MLSYQNRYYNISSNKARVQYSYAFKKVHPIEFAIKNSERGGDGEELA